MPETISTAERLARDLEAAHAPRHMIENARAFVYDDYKSSSAFNLSELVNDCKMWGLDLIADAAMNGEYDGTKEEAEAWAKSPEGKATFDELANSIKKKK